MQVLKLYLKRHKLSQQAFADRLDVSQGLVWQWLNGRSKVTGDMAVKIEDLTGGEVTRKDLRPEFYRGMAA